jgi:DNA polymerase-3 subunit delta
MIYLLHGEDEYRRSLQLEKWKADLGDATTVALNTTELDGRWLTLHELLFACDAFPFLAEKRLVIVSGLASRFQRRSRDAAGRSEENAAFLQQFEDYVGTMPDTARLVLVESSKIEKGNPIFKIVSGSDHGYEEEFAPLRTGDLSRWITKHVNERGGQIEAPAASMLARYVGNTLRLLVNEIDKLLTYVGPERAITQGDVERLVSYAQEANIFHMVDALGTRNTRRAMELVEQLLGDGQHPLYLMNMITRQFRILLQIKELQAKGTSAGDIRALLGLHPFVVQKTVQQARNFSMRQLEEIYHRLLEMDVAMKSGEMDQHLALNLFVTGVRSH